MLSLTGSTNPYTLGGSMSTSQLVLGILGILVVLFGAYYATAVVARRAGALQQGRAVRILDRFAVSKDKMFCLIEMAGTLYLIGMSEGAVTVIDRVEGETAEALRQSCDQVQNDNLLARGAGFLAARLRAGKFDSSLRQAKRRLEAEERETDSDTTPGLTFAQPEDDIDAMLRQISQRKRRRTGDDAAQNDEKGDGL